MNQRGEVRVSNKLEGLCAVLATPFDSSGRLDLESLECEVRFYLDRGATSLLALGVMGEGPALSPQEGLEVIRHVVETAGARTPLLVGAVGMAVDEACEFGKVAVDAGASSLMLSAPQSAAESLGAAVDYLGKVSSAAEAPFVLLDCPGFAPELSVDDLVELSRQLDSFCAVKLEDNPTHLKIGELKSRLGERLAVFGANGGVLCLFELKRGCDGFMTGYAYPEHLIEIFDSHRSGNADRAADAYARFLPLITYCWQPVIGMALRKELLVQRGVIASPCVRAPHVSVDPETRAELLKVAERVTGSQDGTVAALQPASSGGRRP